MNALHDCAQQLQVLVDSPPAPIAFPDYMKRDLLQLNIHTTRVGKYCCSLHMLGSSFQLRMEKQCSMFKIRK